MRKQFLTLVEAFIFTGGLFFLSSCATTTGTVTRTLQYPPEVSVVQPNFTYEPAKESNPLPVNIAFSLIHKEVDMACGSNPQLNEVIQRYVNALDTDFQATLIAKGYQISGPFSDRDQMTYGEKEKAMLLMVPSLKLEIKCQDEKSRESTFSEAKTGQSKTATRGDGASIFLDEWKRVTTTPGTLYVSADIGIVLYEPLTGEKLWIKSIRINAEPEPYSHCKETTYWLGGTLGESLFGKKQVYGQPTVAELPRFDERPVALAKVLEALFPKELSEFARYFDPREISQVVKDAEKVRKIKRY